MGATDKVAGLCIASFLIVAAVSDAWLPMLLALGGFLWAYQKLLDR